MTATEFEIHLKEKKGVDVPQDIFNDFTAYFEEAVNKSLSCDPESSNEIYGTLCENIEKSDDDDDCITVPIEDKNHIDGGFIQVSGWKEVEEGDEE